MRLGPAIVFNRVGAARKANGLTIGPVNLRVKGKVGSSPFRLGWVNPPLLVANLKGGRSRLAVFIENFELDLVGRQAGKEKVRFIAEAEVLRALAYVKLELCLPFPTIPAVEREVVFEFQPPELA